MRGEIDVEPNGYPPTVAIDPDRREFGPFHPSTKHPNRAGPPLIRPSSRQPVGKPIACLIGHRRDHADQTRCRVDTSTAGKVGDIGRPQTEGQIATGISQAMDDPMPEVSSGPLRNITI